MQPLSEKLLLQLTRPEKYCNELEATNEHFFEWLKMFLCYSVKHLEKVITTATAMGKSIREWDETVINKRLEDEPYITKTKKFP